MILKLLQTYELKQYHLDGWDYVVVYLSPLNTVMTPKPLGLQLFKYVNGQLFYLDLAIPEHFKTAQRLTQDPSLRADPKLARNSGTLTRLLVQFNETLLDRISEAMTPYLTEHGLKPVAYYMVCGEFFAIVPNANGDVIDAIYLPLIIKKRITLGQGSLADDLLHQAQLQIAVAEAERTITESKRSLSGVPKLLKLTHILREDLTFRNEYAGITDYKLEHVIIFFSAEAKEDEQGEYIVRFHTNTAYVMDNNLRLKPRPIREEDMEDLVEAQTELYHLAGAIFEGPDSNKGAVR